MALGPCRCGRSFPPQVTVNSPAAPLHFLQVWFWPQERGLTPRYTEWHPKAERAAAAAAKVLLISPDGGEGSATIYPAADKTWQRDLVAVGEMELNERKVEGVRARRGLILTLVPWRRTIAKPKAGA